jgi:sugar phosphate isomerase/epimerase
VYSVHGGFVTDPIGFDGTSFVFPEPDSADAATRAQERFAEALRPAVARAEQLHVRLLVENNVCSERHVGKLLLQRAEEFAALFEALPSPALGALIDFGHLNVSARVLSFDRLEMISALAPHVGGFHVHDNDGLADSHRPIRAGGWVTEVLGRAEFAGLPAAVEARFDDAAELAEHVRWLEREIATSTVSS